MLQGQITALQGQVQDAVSNTPFLATSFIQAIQQWVQPYQGQITALVYVLINICAAWYAFKPSREAMKHSGDKDYREAGRSGLAIVIIFVIANVVATGVALGLGAAIGGSVGESFNNFG